MRSRALAAVLALAIVFSQTLILLPPRRRLVDRLCDPSDSDVVRLCRHRVSRSPTSLNSIPELGDQGDVEHRALWVNDVAPKLGIQGGRQPHGAARAPTSSRVWTDLRTPSIGRRTRLPRCPQGRTPPMAYAPSTGSQPSDGLQAPIAVETLNMQGWAAKQADQSLRQGPAVEGRWFVHARTVDAETGILGPAGHRQFGIDITPATLTIDGHRDLRIADGLAGITIGQPGRRDLEQRHLYDQANLSGDSRYVIYLNGCRSGRRDVSRALS